MPALPRPETCRVDDVLRDLATACADEQDFPSGLEGLDQRLLNAAVEDVRRLLQAVLCRFGERASGRSSHDRKRRNMLTACGWVEVSRVYCPATGASLRNKRPAPQAACDFPLDNAIGLEQGATPAAWDTVARCAALCGSFAEGRDMLVRLTPLRIATSTLRAMALRLALPFTRN